MFTQKKERKYNKKEHKSCLQATGINVNDVAEFAMCVPQTKWFPSRSAGRAAAVRGCARAPGAEGPGRRALGRAGGRRRRRQQQRQQQQQPQDRPRQGDRAE